MRGRAGSSFARPASRTTLKAAMSEILTGPAPGRLLAAQGLDLADEGLLGDVAADGMVDLDDGRQRALPEAGHGADREAPVGRREGELVGLVGALLEAQLELDALEQRPRAARVAGRAAADGHRCDRPGARG